MELYIDGMTQSTVSTSQLLEVMDEKDNSTISELSKIS